MMTYRRVTRNAALAMLLLAGGGTWTGAQNKADKQQPPATESGEGKGKGGKSKGSRPDRPSQTEDADASAAQTTQGLGGFGRVLPVGEKNEDVKIPSFKDGIPSSTVRAASMTRLDEENMAMERMDIRLFGESHDKDVRVQLLTAMYHMPSQILSSETRSRVSRQDFDLQGDSMIFDTRTGQGKMTGHVRMTIYDSDSFTPKNENGPTASKEKNPGKGTSSVESSASPSPTATSAPPSNEKK